MTRMLPAAMLAFRARGWRILPGIERVYDNARARAALGWEPATNFATAVQRLARCEDWRIPLAIAIGSKGYHRK